MILVAAASRHGSTQEIAERIALVLRSHGHEAVCAPMSEVSTLDEVDHLIIGSGIYMGAWLKEAEAFVEAHGAAIRALPTWAFSSGPIGDPPKPEGTPERAEATLSDLGLLEHKVFAGRVERGRLKARERLVVTMVKAGYGDFREWDVIETWAAEVGAQVAAGQVGQAG